MAKRQNFVVGSINPNTNTWSSSELNNGWDKYQVLYSGDLDGVFNAVSDYSNDSSQEIANAIQALTGAQPTGASQNELAGALQQMREDIETSSLTFKGYVATSAPSSSTYRLVEGNIWINASAMPTTFPVAASSIKVWNGTSWVNYSSAYTPSDFDFFRNINDNEGYYWFGGMWTVMSTDMSTTYFTLNQTTGKWEIKSSVNLPGAPTTTTAATADNSTKIATTAFVKNVLEGYVPSGGAANTSLSNLADEGKNIGNWSSNVTNCIAEISQDIKLELSSGTLTIKSGSKVYVPNGTNTFTTLTIASDIALTPGTYTDTYMLFIRNNASLLKISKANCFSGATQPTGISGWNVWYDTTNNSVKLTTNGGSTWESGVSLPMGIISTVANTSITLNQIFNGFGYIGTTVFALPGVKGLIPNGRNTDGTLKNTNFTLASVQTKTATTVGSDMILRVYANGALFWGTSTNVYDSMTNYNKSSGVIDNSCYFGTITTTTGGVITSFNTKPAFHAANNNEVMHLIGDETVGGNKDFTGSLTAPTQLSSDSSTRVATTAWVNKFLRRTQSNSIPALVQISDSQVHAGGDIQLTQSFLNFDYIAVWLTNDSGGAGDIVIYPTWKLDKLLLQSSVDCILAGTGYGSYWVISPYSGGSTNTFFKNRTENCVILAIYGFDL